MRVGLDIAPLVQTRAGTARWVKGLRGALEARDDVEVEPLAWGGAGRLTAVARDVAWYPVLLPRAAARAGVDVLHCTIFRAPSHTRVPTILTVHDLAVLRHPDVFPAVDAAVRPNAAAADDPRRRPGDHSLGVLETRGDRARRRGARPHRRRAERRRAGVQGGRPGRGRRLRSRRRNGGAPEEPRARDRGGRRWPALELRVVGDAGWGAVEVAGAHVTRLGFVPDEELARLYRGARCLIFPSLYEGFGIPAAEALASGTPVVTTRGSAMEDVVGDAGVLVDPLDAASIAAGIEEADRRRDELVRLGLERARLYTWERAAEAAVAAYARALA